MEVSTSDESNDKRLKQLRKKLDQIAKLKEKRDKGEILEQNQACPYITCNSLSMIYLSFCDSWQSWQLNKIF